MNKFKKIILSMFLITLVFGISACVPRITKVDNNVKKEATSTEQEKDNQKEVVKATSTEEVTEIITSNIDTSDWQTYRNEEYGFEFKYPENAGPIIEDNGVFWVGGKENGQFVEIFLKNEKDNLKQAIEKELLKGYDHQKCWVANEINGEKNYGYTDSYYNSFVFIPALSYSSKGDGITQIFKNAKNCPGYAMSNGMKFFMADKNNYNRFAFFSIGQYYIYLDENNNKAWQHTFKFIK